MSDTLAYLFAFVTGLGIGLFYFGGLWLTMRQLSVTRRPVLLMIGSFLGRTALCLLGFYLVAAGQWERLLVSILGFLIMRFFLVRRLQPEPVREGVKPWT